MATIRSCLKRENTRGLPSLSFSLHTPGMLKDHSGPALTMAGLPRAHGRSSEETVPNTFLFLLKEEMISPSMDGGYEPWSRNLKTWYQPYPHGYGICGHWPGLLYSLGPRFLLWNVERVLGSTQYDL